MSAIEKYVPQDDEIDRIQRIAQNFANSGYFSDASEALQAFVKISAGAEMGLQPFVSMSGIAIIKGKPVVGAGILAGLLDAHPEFDYTVAWAPNSTDPTSCTVTVFKNGKERGKSSFSVEDAKRANLTSPSRNGEPSMYMKYPRNMLYARAMSNAVAWYAPSVTRSNGRVYVEGELDDAPNPAPARRKRAEQSPPIPSPETVIDVEPVAAAPATDPAAEVIPADPPEAESAAATELTTTPEMTEATKLVIKAMTKKQLDVVRECVEMLGINWDAATPFRLVERFGIDATERDSLLAVLTAAVTPPESIEGEVPFGEDGAERFTEFLDDDTAKNIRAAEAAQDEAAQRIKSREKMAAGGSYGES